MIRPSAAHGAAHCSPGRSSSPWRARRRWRDHDRLLRHGSVPAAFLLVGALALAGCSSSSTAAATSTSTSSSTTSTPATSSTTTTTTTPLPPALAAIYDSMLASVHRATSVHYDATSLETSSTESTHLHFEADVGTSAGTNNATWSGSGHSGAFTIITVGSAIYLKADVNSLVDFFALIPALNASTYASRWISFAPSDKLYASLRSDLTVASMATSLEFRPTSAVTKATTIVMHGKPSSSATAPAGEVASAVMTISRASKRPIIQTFHASYEGATEQSTISFSQWNTAILPTAPSGSITWDSIAAALTPSTTAAG